MIRQRPTRPLGKAPTWAWWRVPLALIAGLFLAFAAWALLSSRAVMLIQTHGAGIPGFWYVYPWGHFLCFFLLTITLLALFWRHCPVLIVCCLIASAVWTELAQQWIPVRNPQWADLLQNVAGVGAGLAVCLLTAGLLRWGSGPPARRGPLPLVTGDDAEDRPEVVRNLMRYLAG